jgi:hypothetical protein
MEFVAVADRSDVADKEALLVLVSEELRLIVAPYVAVLRACSVQVAVLEIAATEAELVGVGVREREWLRRVLDVENDHVWVWLVMSFAVAEFLSEPVAVLLRDREGDGVLAVVGVDVASLLLECEMDAERDGDIRMLSVTWGSDDDTVLVTFV